MFCESLEGNIEDKKSFLLGAGHRLYIVLKNQITQRKK